MARLAGQLGLSTQVLEQIDLFGHEPAYRSSFRLGTLAQASVALAGAAAAEMWHQRSGALQRVSVHMVDAAIAFRSDSLFRDSSRPMTDPWDPLSGAYQCGDSAWIRVHTNYPHHRAALLRALEAAPHRAGVEAALRRLRAEEAAALIAVEGGIASVVRTYEDWLGHPHAAALRRQPEIDVRSMGRGNPRELPHGARPLSGVRVLDLTRVIAGPVSTQILAAHGADVLSIFAPHLPNSSVLLADTGRGKRVAMLDLRLDEARRALRSLIGECDVLVQSYSPGALDKLGFGAADIAAINPAIVHVSLSAYGHEGPLASAKGFDSIVQAATGFNWEEAGAFDSDTPLPLPCQALDYGTGYLMAAAAMAGLVHQQRTGEARAYRLSLARTGQWLTGLGRVTPDTGEAEDPGAIERVRIGDFDAGIYYIAHAARFSQTPAHDFMTGFPPSAAAWRENRG